MRSFVCFLSLLTFTFVGCSSETISTVVAPSVDTLNADQLKALAESGDNYVLVDVRPADEIEKNGTIEGYLHIPIGEFEQRYSEVPKDKKVVVMCERGGRAGRGASVLLEHGYTDVHSVGLAEYREKGYDLIHPPAGE
jgi:rhodanese-related sulfurtransferase